MLRITLAALVVAAASVATSDAQAAPLAFHHTGRLADTLGVPLNQDVTLTVSLSTTEGGAAFWSQEFQDVPLQDGYFGLEVGAGPPALTTEDLDHSEVWLTTAFPGGSTSHRLLAVPYAARAEVANSLQGEGAVVQMATVQTRTQGTYTAPPSGLGSAITPMDIVITPRKAGNKVLLEWTLNGEIHQDAVFLVTGNGSLLPLATNASNNRWAGTSATDYDQNESSTPTAYTVTIVDENSLDTASTYQVFVRSSSSGTYTFALNRALANTGADAVEATLSVGTATEIWQNP